MSKSNIITAVDIGSSKIATLIAQLNYEPAIAETTVNVIGVSTSAAKGVKKGQIVDIDAAVESVVEAVESAERMAGYNLESAYISIGGAHISSQNSTGVVAISDPSGEVTPSDVERVIEAARAISLPASREVVHVVPREFIVDGEPGVRDPVGMSGVRLEVDTHIVTASSAALKNLAKTVTEVGLHVEDIVFNGYAATFSTLTSTEKELGCVVIDIGAGTTSVAAYVDGALSYSGAIPIGARNVTNDLAIGLRVSLEAAEQIKLQLGRPPKEDGKKDDYIEIPEDDAKELKKVSRRTLVEGIIRPRLNELFTIIRMDLERAGILNKIPSGAVLTGGGALTVGVVESAKRVLALPTRIAVPSGVGGLIDDIMTPEFAAPIGLLLMAAESDKTYGTTNARAGNQKKMKVPNKAVFGKIIDSIKDLLP